MNGLRKQPNAFDSDIKFKNVFHRMLFIDKGIKLFHHNIENGLIRLVGLILRISAFDRLGELK
jgi:hypothetical protein